MSTVRDAVALLTRFPVATAATREPGVAAFGVVGAAVAAAAAVPLVVLAGPAAEPWLGSIAAVAVLAVATGGIHLDGLADTADALVARDAEAAERARKDPRLGPGGTIALVLAVAAQVAALASLVGASPLTAGLALVSVGAVSRVVPVLAIPAVRRWSVAVPASTLGGWFTDRLSPAAVIIAGGSAAVVVIVAALGSRDGVMVVAAAGIGAVVLGLAAAVPLAAWRRGIDGDGMGALVELSMVGGLATAAVVAG